MNLKLYFKINEYKKFSSFVSSDNKNVGIDYILGFDSLLADIMNGHGHAVFLYYPTIQTEKIP